MIELPSDIDDELAEARQDIILRRLMAPGPLDYIQGRIISVDREEMLRVQFHLPRQEEGRLVLEPVRPDLEFEESGIFWRFILDNRKGRRVLVCSCGVESYGVECELRMSCYRVNKGDRFHMQPFYIR